MNDNIEQISDEFEEEDRSIWQWSRIAIGVLAIIAMGIEYINAHNDAENASDLDASAIQIVQVWTPHLFDMMAVIGVAIGAYIITRVAE